MPKRYRASAVSWSFLVFGSAYLLLRLFFLRYRDFNVDEFEHLHVAWCMAHGQVLYKDFFEHHGPLWYGVLQFIPRVVDNPFQALWAGRFLSMAFWAGILILQGHLTEPEWSSRYRALSVVMLCSFTVFASKSLEIRPDVPAAFFASLILVLGLQPLTLRRRILMGLCFGVGFLFSPKIIYPIGGYGMGLILERERRMNVDFRGRVQFVGPVILAALIPWIACLWLLYAKGALKSFYECFWLFNWHEKAIHSSARIFSTVVFENFFLWTLALVGVWRVKKNLSLKWAFATSMAGLFVTHFVHRQNYLYVAPLACFFATGLCFRFFGWVSKIYAARYVRWWWMGWAVLVLAFPFWEQVTDWQSNVDQLKGIHSVMENTDPRDPIISFKEGDAIWRPHVYYYWWLLPIHRHALGAARVNAMVLDGLRDPKCRGVIYEFDYFNDDPPALSYMLDHYYRVGEGRLYLRSPS